MTLRIDAVDLSAETREGTFECSVVLNPGLNLISADNTTGKSTFVQSIIYGLGLEKMLSPHREVPLPRVMTVELRERKDGPEIPVLASRVRLQVRNSVNDVITVERAAKGDRDRRLITVYSGPGITGSGRGFGRHDYYVRDPGAAQSSRGFHRFLAMFLNWDLPRVPRYPSGDAPLYLEAIFALVFVEQKAGWSALPANFPTYLGIRDMPRRAVEYVLGLEVYEVEVRRQEISTKISRIRERWASLADEAHRIADSASGRADGIPNEPDLNWSPDDADILIPEAEEWMSLETLGGTLEGRLRAERQQVIPTAEQDAAEANEELEKIVQELLHLRAVRHELLNSLTLERSQLRVTERQLSGIEEDLSRHRDAAKILSIGGDVGATLAPERCPTCHQDLNDILLEPGTIDRPMSIEENKDFLTKQRALFRNLRARSEALVRKNEKELVRLNGSVQRVQNRVRALQETLSSAGSAPSTAAVQRRVELQARLENLQRVEAVFYGLVEKLQDLRENYRDLKSTQAELPAVGLPSEDRRRLGLLRKSIVKQLNEYEFTTFRPEEIELSEHSYRPVREGFEIGFELSASDAIRLKWAYQLALLEVTHQLQGAHHPGILVFDEPRQQETDRMSFHNLISRTSRVSPNTQVIFTTSEHKPTLHKAVEGLPLKLIDFPEYLLTLE